MDRETWDRLERRGERLEIEHPATALHGLAGKVAVLCAGSAIATILTLAAALFDEPARLGLSASTTDVATPVGSAQSEPPVQLPPALTPTAGGARRVGNTAGEGVYLRRTPRADDRLRLLSEGVAVEALGPRVEAGGLGWLKVRDPNGDEGWLPEQYLLPP